MKSISFTFSIFSLMFSSVAAASNLTLPSINLGGVSLSHSLEHPVKGSISLKPLSDFTSDGTWNISCDFNVTETNGVPAPSASDPFAVTITLKATGTILGDDYTSSGFIAQSGKFQIINAQTLSNSGSIDFVNYDTTGDLAVSNCIAKLQLDYSKTR